MPIRNQIEAVVNSMPVVPPAEVGGQFTVPNFLYGTTKELNALADDADFPCVFLYAIQPIDAQPGVNGSVNNIISVLLAFCQKTEFDQYSAEDEELVNEALQWSNLFLVKVADYRVGERKYFRVKSGLRGRVSPFYNRSENEVCLSGVTLAVDLQVMYDTKMR